VNKRVLTSISYLLLNFILVCSVDAKIENEESQELEKALLKNSPVLKLLNNKVFEKPEDSLVYNPQINANFEMVAVESSTYFNLIKDDYKTHKNNKYHLSRFPIININLQQKGQSIYPSSNGFKPNKHPNWEWQVSKGEIWHELESNLLKLVLPFALGERNANCTHTGYIYLSKSVSKIDEPRHGYYQKSA
jgi:hypothetical protein